MLYQHFCHTTEPRSSSLTTYLRAYFCSDLGGTLSMDIDQILLAVAVMITATIVVGSVAKKLSLGSIVALLVVGMALGPYSPTDLPLTRSTKNRFK
jgi:hypothetical protein